MSENEPIQLPKLFCQRCKHRWTPRYEHTPKICPKCKSELWPTPKGVKPSSAIEMSREEKRFVDLYLQFRKVGDPAKVKHLVDFMVDVMRREIHDKELAG